MERAVLQYSIDWLASPDRKPLVLRGARQVGKTWLVRHLAQISGKQLIELNFEKQPAYASLFTSNDPQQILINLGTVSNKITQPENCLLFLDEIQIAPEIFSKLRWFAEDMPQLAVIAAGSLLDFVLQEHSFSMPVGRITYMHLEPLSFEEFLLAQDKKSLYEYLQQYDFNITIPSVIHEQLTALFKEYLLIGGMPAAVSNWANTHSLNKISQIQNDLLATYRDDFSKYSGRLAVTKLDEVMMAIPRMLGNKFVFSHIHKDISSASSKQIISLIEKARICSRVKSVAANGVPLISEVKEKYFKEIFIDVGLCSTALGLNLTQMHSVNDISMINNGGIAEQIVGQLLRTITQPYIEPALYCWHRDEPGASAEIDYIIQHAGKVIPIEVKAGSTGSLKSLHVFMRLKKLPIAMRINSDYPSITNIDVKDPMGNPIKYSLLSIPFYLIGQIHRLLDTP